MNIFTQAEQYYYEAKENKWLSHSAVFFRFVLALGFIPSGIVKIMGERFTGLPATHPLGQYFDALHHTGYYYTFIGCAQLATAVLLLIPRTSLLGVIIYFPIILNICILAYSTRFEGTRITTLMLLANLFLLCWHYDRLRFLLDSKPLPKHDYPVKKSNKFPVLFFGCVIVAVTSVIAINHFLYDIRPGNSPLECTNGCPGNENPKACAAFCDCIYNKGNTLEKCLKEYEKAIVVENDQ